MSTKFKKEDAHSLVDQLPDDATWGDLMHEIYVREAIDKGIEDSDAGRVISTTEVRKKFSLTS